MVQREQVLGRWVGCALQTPWKESPGYEMPGVAGPIWSYAHFYLPLDNGTFLQLDCYELTVHSSRPAGLIALDRWDIDPRGSQIAQVLRWTPDDYEPDHASPDHPPLVCFSDGSYLCDDWGPGGNQLLHSTFGAWEAEERTSIVDY